MAHIILPARVDRAATRVLVGDFRSAIAGGGDIIIESDEVERIGQAGLQLLISAHKSAAATGTTCTIVNPSAALIDAAALTGLSSYLFPATPVA